MLIYEIEIITDGGRRRRWSAADKRRIVEKNMYDGESIAVAADDSITGNKAVRDMAYDYGTGDPKERAGHITGKKRALLAQSLKRDDSP
ncbi:MAG: hypothetical protein HRT62_13745 [Epibacterium sp.]|nr:hypothetical protein [Epibacterium sp.]